MQKQSQFENDTKALIEEIQTRNSSIRILVHDIKNHLLSISSICDDQRQVREYISELLNSPALKTPIRFCHNDFINAIIFRYSQTAEMQKIAFNVETSMVVLDFISNYDLTVILCNLLDNALEAAIKCKSPVVNLCITSDINKKICLIKISNSYTGIVDCDKLITTKSEQDSHGYGLISVKKTLDKYNGHLQQYISEDKVLFNTIVSVNWGTYDNCNL